MKLRSEEMFLNIIMKVYDKPIANNVLNREKMKQFFQKFGIRQGCPLFPPLLNIVLEFLARALSKEKEMKGIQIRKERGCGVSHVVEHLPSKCKALSSSPSVVKMNELINYLKISLLLPKKGKKDLKIDKEEDKLSLFADGIIPYFKKQKPKELPKSHRPNKYFQQSSKEQKVNYKNQ
jgi:hypothetical protein